MQFSKWFPVDGKFSFTVISTDYTFSSSNSGITSFRRNHFGGTISARPFLRHLFRCRTFSAQIVSAPIWCSLTVHLFWVWVRVSKKHRILAQKRSELKWSRRKVVDPNICGGRWTWFDPSTSNYLLNSLFNLKTCPQTQHKL